jgi:hypothetical protein
MTERLSILVSSWRDGVLVLDAAGERRELAGASIGALAADGRGGALAIVDGKELRRRDPNGRWTTFAVTTHELACCVAATDAVYAGTDDAQVLRIDRDGRIEPLRGFEAVAGRDRWYAGRALIDGRLVGPPLGIRSISATCDGAVLLANVHVGGIPRSTDGGVTWQPTIDIEADVHEVRAHPTRPQTVAAASAVGLCTSHDGGATWRIDTAGMHAAYSSAVAFTSDDVLICAAVDHFAPQAAIYRRRVDNGGALERVTGGLPPWLHRMADTRCIAARGGAVAVADGAGNVYLSLDDGRTWAARAAGLPQPSSVLLV